MKFFIGVGLGPIQTNIFFEGAFHGGFDSREIADLWKIRSGLESPHKNWYDEIEAA